MCFHSMTHAYIYMFDRFAGNQSLYYRNFESITCSCDHNVCEISGDIDKMMNINVVETGLLCVFDLLHFF